MLVKVLKKLVILKNTSKILIKSEALFLFPTIVSQRIQSVELTTNTNVYVVTLYMTDREKRMLQVTGSFGIQLPWVLNFFFK